MKVHPTLTLLVLFVSVFFTVTASPGGRQVSTCDTNTGIQNWAKVCCDQENALILQNVKKEATRGDYLVEYEGYEYKRGKCNITPPQNGGRVNWSTFKYTRSECRAQAPFCSWMGKSNSCNCQNYKLQDIKMYRNRAITIYKKAPRQVLETFDQKTLFNEENDSVQFVQEKEIEENQRRL